MGKRVISLILTVVIAVSAIPLFSISASALPDYYTLDDFAFDGGVSESTENAVWQRITDGENLARGVIDLRGLSVPKTDKNLRTLRNILESILYVRFVSDVRFTGTETVDHVIFTPDDPEKLLLADAELERLCTGVKNNDALSDELKALILHDRFVSKVSYSTEGTYSGQTYTDAMLENTCVCAGYSRAYLMLCRKCGIRCYYMDGKANPGHAWNVVFINGKEYYVDTTWDDNDNRAFIGYVIHKYFLSSASAFDHSQYDHYVIPDNTEFDNAEWKESRSVTVEHKGELYYVSANIRYNIYELHRVGDPDFCISLNNMFANLISDGDDLIVSQKRAIYKVDLESERLGECIFTMSTEDNEAGYGILGMELKNGKILMDYAKATLYFISASADVQRREFSYDKYIPAPECSVRSLDRVNENGQEYILSFSDNGPVTGYYWGTSPTAENNPFTELNGENTVRKTVTEPGTYYLWAVDSLGYISKPFTVTVDKITYNIPGGTSTCSLNTYGEEFYLPEYVYGDSIHRPSGWRITSGEGEIITEGDRFLLVPYTDVTVTPTGVSGKVSGYVFPPLDDDPSHVIHWELDLDSDYPTLYFEGLGKTPTYAVNHQSPWYEYRSVIKKVVVGEGITGFGNLSFYGCTAIESAVLPSTLTVVGKSTFKNSSRLKEVFYNGNADGWAAVEIQDGNVPLTNSAFTLISKGDTDFDGKVTAADANLLKKAVTGRVSMIDEKLIAADLNRDGKLTVGDVLLEKNLITGKVTEK